MTTQHLENPSGQSNPSSCNQIVCKCGLQQLDWVSVLKERSDKERLLAPAYSAVRKEGLDHRPKFTVTCKYGAHETFGEGFTIKSAKQAAAREWIARERMWQEANLPERADMSIGLAQMAKIAKASWNLGRACLGYDEPSDESLRMTVARIGLSAVQVAQNLTPRSVVVFILQIATEFGYTPDVLIKELASLLMMAADCSKQLIQNLLANIKLLFEPIVLQGNEALEHAEPSIGLEIPEFEPAQLAGAAGALGGCAVLIAALLTGTKDYSSQKGFLKHIAEFSTKLSKFKGGLYALMDMVKHFSVFVRDSVLGFLGACTPSTIVRAVESLELKLRGRALRSDEFFSMIEKLNSLEGEEAMGMNPEALQDGQFALHVISKIATQNMSERFSIPPSAMMALADLRRTFEPRVRSAAIRQAANRSRFVPFSIWLAGKSGVGKSVAMNFISEWLMKALEQEPDRYELPARERYFFSANFTQEYHTGYSGQYIFAIDDMCQDKPGSLRNSSAMQFIQWVSNIPANVTQAALEDKRCPFTSKVILCSSNITHPNRSAEIVEQEAFLRRRHMLIYAAESAEVDPTLKRKIKFSLLDSKKETNCVENPLEEYDSFSDMMVAIVQAYKAHFAEQKVLEDAICDAPGLSHFLNKVAYVPANAEDVEDAMRESEDYREPDEVDGSERAELSADYTLPTCLRPTELVRQCKFVATRLCDQLCEISRKNVWRVVAGISAAAAVAFGFYQWSHSGGRVYDEDEEWSLREDCDCCRCRHADASYDKKIVRKAASKVVKMDPSYNKELVRARARAQVITAVRSSFVESLRMKNIVKVSRTIDGITCSQNGLFVKGRILLTCRHFFYKMTEGEIFTITEYPQFERPHESRHTFTQSKMHAVSGAKDAAMYEAGAEVQCHKDIVGKFFQSDLPRSIQASAIGVYPTQVWQTGIAQLITRRIEHSLGFEEDDEVVQIDGFEMFGIAEKGRSGAILASDETQNRAPTIFGIQVSISKHRNNSYFEAITRSQIEETLREFAPVKAEASMDEFCSEVPETMADLCKSSLVYVGPAKQPVHQMQTTMLRPSMLHDRFEKDEDLAEYLPSALSSRAKGANPELAGTDVLKLSMSGYERSYGTVDVKLADAILEEFIQEDKSTRKHRTLKPRLLTNHEVLNGIVGHGLKGVELNTSPGLPYLHHKEKGKAGKRTWIEMNEQQERIMQESLWKEFDTHEEMLKRGEEPDYLAYACLKDELRPVKKIWDLKTRSFIILPMQMNFMIRKYFGVWTAVQHSKAGQISSCVGIDVNTEWTDLKKNLMKVGSAVEDFDYTDWDRSLHAEWFRLYADRVSAWHGDRWGSAGWTVRRTLMDILAHMKIQIGGHVVQTYGGNKSGCAITAEVNTDVHDMLAYYVWVKVCRATGHDGIATLDSFRDNVSLALYGDDMLKVTTKSVAKWFNGDSMLPHISALGMKITPGDKLSTEFTIKTIDEVTFLKRRFLEEKDDFGLVRAPLDKSVIQRMVLWVHKSDDPIAACKANVKGALCEAFFWGEDFFLDFADRARRAWDQEQSHGEQFPTVTYQILHYNWTHKVVSDWIPAQFQYRSERGVEGPSRAD